MKTFSTAIHEAGHAVAAIHFKIPVRFARIHEANGLRGYALLNTHRRQFGHIIQVFLAGGLAQRKYEPWSDAWFYGAGKDFADVAALAPEMAIPQAAAGVITHGAEQAKQLVELLYGDILKVAEVLMEREVLTGKQIKAILAKPRRRKPIQLQVSSLTPTKIRLLKA